MIARYVFTLVYFCWYAAVVVKAIAAYRLLHNGLIRRFPFIWTWIVLTAVRSGVQILLQHNRAQYAAFQSATAPAVLLLEVLCVVEIFRALTEKYPNFRSAGYVFFGLAGAAGVLVSVATSGLLVPRNWSALWQVMMLLDRYAALAMVVSVAAFRVSPPRVQGIPIRPSAERAACVFAVQAVFDLIQSGFTIATSGTHPFLASFLPTFGCLVSSILWAIMLTPASDKCSDPAPVPEHEIEAAHAARRFLETVCAGPSFANQRRAE